MVYTKAILLPLLTALLAQAVPNGPSNDVSALAVRTGGGGDNDGPGRGNGDGNGRGGDRDDDDRGHGGDHDDDDDHDGDNGHGGHDNDNDGPGRGNGGGNGHGNNGNGKGPKKCGGYKNWKPVEGGCWQDHNSDRALDHYLGSFPDLTPQKCMDMCEAQGFFLAGVEFREECSCGNTIMDRNGPAADAACNMPCAGDAKQLCGGQDAMNLYVRDGFQFTRGPAAPLDSYKGYKKNQCQVDSTSNRTLKGRPNTAPPTDLMTVEKCIDACAATGYTSAGLVFGRECYCDNVTTLPGPAKDINECNMPCLGDASEYCGGPDRVLIYTKNTRRSLF